MRTSVVKAERARLARLYPGRAIGEGTILRRKPHLLIRFTVGEEVITVRRVPAETTRRAMRSILAQLRRARGPRLDVVKLLREARDGRG